MSIIFVDNNEKREERLRLPLNRHPMLCNFPYSQGPDPAIHENQRLQQRRFRQR